MDLLVTVKGNCNATAYRGIRYNFLHIIVFTNFWPCRIVLVLTIDLVSFQGEKCLKITGIADMAVILHFKVHCHYFNAIQLNFLCIALTVYRTFNNRLWLKAALQKS